QAGGISWLLTLLEVGKTSYFLPLALAWEEDEEHVRQLAQSTLVRVRQQANVGVIGDAMADEGFCRNVVKAIGESRSLPTGQGSIRFTPTEAFRRIAGEDLAALTVGPLQAQSTNTSVTLSERLFLKCYRKLRPGVNPELEVGRFLTEVAEFRNCVPVAGAVEYLSENKEPVTLALLQSYVPNQGDGWSYTLEYLRRWLETQRGTPDASHAAYLLLIQTLATRTAELHRALATPSRNPAFTPEPLASADVEAWKSRQGGSRADPCHAQGFRAAGAKSGGAGADRFLRRAARQGAEDPPSRRLPSRPGPARQQRLVHHRLRGRAVASAR